MPLSNEWLSRKRLATAMQVSPGTVNVRRYLKGFPDDAIQKIEGRLYFNRPKVEQWNASRPKAQKARRDREFEETEATYLAVVR